MNALILMSRIPIPGETKTRLMKVLSGEECAQIHRCFLMDIFDALEKIKGATDVFLTYTPEDSLGIIKGLVPEWVSSFPQKGGNLGDRMRNSIETLLNRGYKKVILIGSDIPDISAKDIDNAFTALDVQDVVLGPTFDGGYYLIGMKKTHTELFNDNLKWGHKSVFEATVDIANKCSLKVGLASKYRDIDDEKDLLNFIERFVEISCDEKSSATNTIMFINTLWSDLENAKRYINK
jgi:rSAM/selenodomain-associated transferase 1